MVTLKRFTFSFENGRTKKVFKKTEAPRAWNIFNEPDGGIYIALNNADENQAKVGEGITITRGQLKRLGFVEA